MSSSACGRGCGASRVERFVAPPREIDAVVWLQHAWRNRLQSLILLAAMGGFLALLGWLLWGGGGVLMLVTIGLFGALVHPSFSPWWVMRLYGARPIDPNRAPALWNVLQRLAERTGLPHVPRLYYVPSGLLNAFAVGLREQAAIAVSDGLLRKLDLREVAGVLAHEVSHIRSNDLWVMGLADMFSRTTNLLSLVGQLLLFLNLPLILLTGATINWLAILLLIFAPSISALAQLALSRTREYDADLNAARLTGDPDGLARAWPRSSTSRAVGWKGSSCPGEACPCPRCCAPVRQPKSTSRG
jgi:heat shock protein HtpX